MPTTKVWLFDLDNTLHNASHAAFRGIDRAMTDYIVRELEVSANDADGMRRHYWQRYGATLLGLVRHHGVRAAAFPAPHASAARVWSRGAQSPARLCGAARLRGREASS